MRPTRTISTIAFLLVLLTSLLLAGPVAARRPPPPPPPPSAATWQLVDYHQRVCFSSNSTVSWFGIWIDGSWAHAIDVGIDGLPAGGSYTTSYAPIPPGSSDGIYSLASVRVSVKRNNQTGSVTASLWASDGQTREAVPVTLVFVDRCSDY